LAAGKGSVDEEPDGEASESECGPGKIGKSSAAVREKRGRHVDVGLKGPGEKRGRWVVQSGGVSMAISVAAVRAHGDAAGAGGGDLLG